MSRAIALGKVAAQSARACLLLTSLTDISDNSNGYRHTPPELEARAREFTRVLWAQASRQAQREAQSARDEADASVVKANEQLAEAHGEIARLERLDEQQGETIASLEKRLREVELALAEAQVEARRVRDLDAALASARGELRAARKESSKQAVEQGRLVGEAQALRKQVGELMAVLKQTSSKANPKK